jgi:hypothetical protein
MPSAWVTIWIIGLAGPVVLATAEQQQAPAKATADPKASEQDKALAGQVAALNKDYHEREKKFYDDLGTFRNDKKKISDLNREFGEFARKQADKLSALIKRHETAPAAFEGILVLVGDIRYPLDDDLVRLVLKHHLADPRMGRLCFDLRYRSTESWAEKILKEVAANHPQKAVRGQAVYALGDYYRPHPWGPKRSEAEQAKQLAEAARYYTEVTRTYADVPTPDGRAKLGAKAASELTRIKNLPNLKVGKTAPEIVGVDLDGKHFKLSDYRGKVVVLDFWGNW